MTGNLLPSFGKFRLDIFIVNQNEIPLPHCAAPSRHRSQQGGSGKAGNPPRLLEKRSTTIADALRFQPVGFKQFTFLIQKPPLFMASKRLGAKDGGCDDARAPDCRIATIRPDGRR
jgi:hypothetical protein